MTHGVWPVFDKTTGCLVGHLEADIAMDNRPYWRVAPIPPLTYLPADSHEITPIEITTLKIKWDSPIGFYWTRGTTLAGVRGFTPL